MKRKIILICTIISLTALVVLLTQCSNTSVDSNGDTDNESKFYAFTHDLFYHEYSIALFEFSQIISSIAEIKTESDISYLNGRIDGYLSRGTFAISLIRENSTYTKKPIIDPALKEPVFRVIENMNDYLKKIQIEVLKKNDINMLNDIKADLLELSELAKELNVESSLLQDKNSMSGYLDTIQKMEKIMLRM